ncbi:uncharacterized protein TNCT_207721 [Trichonephila clavata]|uniref:CCHC-type domain-containing protein n=1 Tax=Trichonephila clavata TaxID=2740835 RepID=A0A8X6FPY2_TRICU|nr:uncharacterized protein TNCT_207721 [Trichonephila clavata]
MENFVYELLQSVIKNVIDCKLYRRVSRVTHIILHIDEERKQEEQTLRELELQKIRLQIETQRVVGLQPLPSGPKRYEKGSETLNVGRQVSSRKPERLPKREYSHEVPNERSPLKCYGCGKPGVIKSRCPSCNPNSSQGTEVATNHINAYTAQTKSPD